MLLDWEDELRDYERAVDLSNRSVVGARFRLAGGTEPPPPHTHTLTFRRSLSPNAPLFDYGQTRGHVGLVVWERRAAGPPSDK